MSRTVTSLRNELSREQDAAELVDDTELVDPVTPHLQFDVDGRTVRYDVESKQVMCLCEDKKYNGVSHCKHELAVITALTKTFIKE